MGEFGLMKKVYKYKVYLVYVYAVCVCLFSSSAARKLIK